MGEIRDLDKLVVMDDVSGLADKSNKFRNFLTASRKFCYSCLYIFHITFPNRCTWQMILAQTKTCNIFPSAIQLGNMLKTLTNNCNQETVKYILSRDLSVNRIYVSIANEKKHSCTTIDCTKTGLAKHRTTLKITLNRRATTLRKQDRICNRFLFRNLNEDVSDLTFAIDCVTKSIKKMREKPYKTNRERIADMQDGHEQTTESTQQHDKGDNRGGAKRGKRPKFLLL